MRLISLSSVLITLLTLLVTRDRPSVRWTIVALGFLLLVGVFALYWERTHGKGRTRALVGTTGNAEVVLLTVGKSKIHVIRAVRESTGLGLREIKAIVDDANVAPRTVARGVSQDAAESIKSLPEAAGATAQINFSDPHSTH